MGRNIDDIIESLPKQRRDKINARAEKLAAGMIGKADSIAALRQLSGVTQKELGELLGVNQNSVSQMEKRTDVYLSTLGKVAVALGWELEVALRAPDGKRVELPNFQPWNEGGVAAKAARSKIAPGQKPVRARPRRPVAQDAAPVADSGAKASKPLGRGRSSRS